MFLPDHLHIKTGRSLIHRRTHRRTPHTRAHAHTHATPGRLHIQTSVLPSLLGLLACLDLEALTLPVGGRATNRVAILGCLGSIPSRHFTRRPLIRWNESVDYGYDRCRTAQEPTDGEAEYKPGWYVRLDPFFPFVCHSPQPFECALCLCFTHAFLISGHPLHLYTLFPLSE